MREQKKKIQSVFNLLQKRVEADRKRAPTRPVASRTKKSTTDSPADTATTVISLLEQLLRLWDRSC